MQCNGQDFHGSELTYKELEKPLANLNLNKRPVWKYISTDVVKGISDKKFSVLKHILKVSLNQGVFLRD